MNRTAQRQSRGRLAVFAAGDFAFNLFWQSVMLFLLFYYTDTLGIGMELAATMYLAASLWDGAVGLVIGVLVDRHGSQRLYRRMLIIGGPFLGISFVLAYLPPRWPGEAGIAALFLFHLLFRTTYALVNVPYLAMSARVSEHSADRATVAGLRMLAGTAAAVVVAICTVPLGTFMTGSKALAFVAAATAYATVGGLLLMIVGATYRDAAPARKSAPVPLSVALAALASNRAFITLAAAMMAMILASTILSKSILYYFKYFVHDEAAGHLALAAMMAVSGAAVPLWMIVARRIGMRQIWLLASAAAIALLLLFAGIDIVRAEEMQIYLVAMQIAMVGLNFALWAMLPDAVDHGERSNGVRVEAALFGMIGLLQRVAIGVATALLGFSFSRAGYTANTAQSVAILAAMRGAIIVLPLSFFALSIIIIRSCPLGRRPESRS